MLFYILPGIIASLAVLLYWPGLIWYYFYGFFTFSCCLFGIFAVIQVHIALSPKHQTGLGTAKTVADMDAFRNMIMVRLF